jgi:hypothetical protein
MTLPAADEPAFIVNSKLGTEEAYTASAEISFIPSSPDSRSTSAGSLTPLPSMAEGEINSPALPDIDYPVPLFVRNTFITAGVARPISLDEFIEERRVHSCPVESLPGLGSGDGSLTMPMPLGLPQPPPFTFMDSVMAAAASASAAAAAASHCWMGKMASCDSPVSPMTSSHQKSEAPILRLADALVEPELGSEELPTIGSAGHRIGDCRPCAFFHTKGCSNGTECSFCHLCPAGEKKRRQREKGTVHRELKRFGLLPEP